MGRIFRSVLLGGFALFAAICLPCNFAQAQQLFNWTNGGGGFAWTNSANWDLGASYPGNVSTTDTAVFPAGSPTGTINVGSPLTLGAISFANQSAGNTIAGSAISLSNSGSIVMTNVNNSGLNNTISAPVTLLGSGTLENDNPTSGSWTGLLNISGSLSGAGALTIASTGSGLVELSGNNSGFTGTINVVATSPNSGGMYGGSVGNASALNFTNGGWHGYPSGITLPITINAGGTYFEWSGYMNSNITLNSGGTLTLGTGGGNQNVYYGAFDGPGAVVLAGNGNIYSGWTDNWFAGANPNTMTGTVLVQSGRLNLAKTAGVNAIGTAGVSVGNVGNTAVVVWQADNQINGTAAFTLLSAGDLASGGGTLSSGQMWLSGHNDTIAGLQDTGGQGTAIVENDTPFTTSTLTISTSTGSSYNYGGRIRDGFSSGMGTLALVVSGSGQQILSGTNTYTGGTTVNGGTLTLNGSLANANIQVNAGTFNGSGLLNFRPGNDIMVGSTGTFDASSGLWNLAGLSSSPIELLNFTSGGTFVAPSSGTLNSLLTPASAAKYTLADVNNAIIATLLANNVWNVDADGTWSNSANWLHGSVPNAVSAPANFGDVITSPRTVSVNIPVTLGSINFNSFTQYTLAGSNSITFNNGPENSTIGVGAGSHVMNAGIVLDGNGALDISVAQAGSTLTIGGNISEAVPGAGVLNIAADSAGTVILSGANTFTGGLNVGGGVLTAAGSQALASTVAVTVTSGATFGLSGGTDNLTIGSLNCQGATAIIYPNGGTLNVAANGGNNVSGLIGDGVVILTSTSSAVVQSLGDNSGFTGSLFINEGQITTPLGANKAFTSASNTTLNDVSWNGFGSTSANFHLTGAAVNFADYGGSPTLSGSISIDPGTTFNWSTGGGNNGVISGALSGGGTLDFVGGGGGGGFEFSPLYLIGAMANTFSGTMFVEQGTLWLQKPDGVNAIAGPLTIGNATYTAHVLLGGNEQINPSVVVSFANNTSDLRLEGFNETVGGLTSNTGNGRIGNYGSSPSTLIVAPVGTTTFGGSLVDGGSGSLGLTISGTGTLVLAGTGTYSGPTVVSSGELIAASPSALPDGANITVGNVLAFPSPVVPASLESQSQPLAAVPEPGTAGLLAVGALLSAAVLRRRRSRLTIVAVAKKRRIVA